jgi:WD40 repeat protein
MATNTNFDTTVNRVLRGVINAVQFNQPVTAENLQNWGLSEVQTQKVQALIQVAKQAEHAKIPLKVKDLKDRLVIALDPTIFHLSRCDGAGNVPDPFASSSPFKIEQPNAIIPQNSSMVDELSDDCLLKVFGLLSLGKISTCNQVCKQWNQFLNSDLAWQHLWQYHFPSTNLGTIQNFQGFVNHLRSNLSTGVCSVKTLRRHNPEFRDQSVHALVVHDAKLFSASEDKTIQIWDLKDNTCIATLEGHTKSVKALAICDGKLFSSSWDQTIQIWDLKDNTCIDILYGHEDGVLSLAVRDGKLFSGSWDQTIQIWDLKDNTCIATLKGHAKGVESLAIIDGKLFSGSADTTIKIWDLKNNTCIATLKGHTKGVKSLAIIDGKLFSGSDDKTIKIWDLRENTCIATLYGHTGYVTSLAVIDGKLFSASTDRTIKIWDLKDNTCIATLEGHNGNVESLALRDGKLFSGASASDNSVKIWDFTASHAQIFEEIANALESQDQNETEVIFALKHFSKMPEEAKNKIFAEFQKIVKPTSKRGYWKSAEHVFCGRSTLLATDAQRAQAIRKYLG